MTGTKWDYALSRSGDATLLIVMRPDQDYDESRSGHHGLGRMLDDCTKLLTWIGLDHVAASIRHREDISSRLRSKVFH